MNGRPYSGAADLHKLISFLVETRARQPMQRWHLGDLVWRMFYSSRFDPARCVRVWEDEQGKVVGFGWLYPPNGADLVPGDPALLPDMIAWADSSVSEGELYLATLDTSRDEVAYFESHGFERQSMYGYHLVRSLDDTIDDAIPAPLLPDGFTLRPLAGADEVEARAILHQQAFGTQNVTVDGYRNVTHAPLYQPDLDLVVFAPDGRMAAFCLGWLDEANRVALFEPVGAHPDFRRMGLARAAMLEALRRMQARGMASVLVATGAENEASNGLYRSLGFRTQSLELIYGRRLSRI